MYKILQYKNAIKLISRTYNINQTESIIEYVHHMSN